MAFSQSIIKDVVLERDGVELRVSWDATVPGDHLFQVYLDHSLAWVGTSRRCTLPLPDRAAARNIWVDVGVVDGGDPRAHYGDQLESLGLGSADATIEWDGGSYADPSGNDDVAGYAVYGARDDGMPSHTWRLLSTVMAYAAPWVSDGYGLGGYGQGGYGRACSTYSCTLRGLEAGHWLIRVVPFDGQGIERGGGTEILISVDAPPRPPALSLQGKRLAYSYSGPESRTVTLRWLPSPSASEA